MEKQRIQLLADGAGRPVLLTVQTRPSTSHPSRWRAEVLVPRGVLHEMAMLVADLRLEQN